MWVYQKKLQYPVKITRPNPALAKVIISQLGGPDGETGAALRYLSQRFAAPTPEMKGILTDVGTEGLKGHRVYHSTAALKPQTVRYSITRLALSNTPPIISDNQCTPETSRPITINTV